MHNEEYTNEKLNNAKEELKNLGKDKAKCISDLRNAHNSSGNYKKIKENYYYHRTLSEFNVDYVMSMKLFDAKVVTAQLLDALVGILTIDLGFNYKRQIIKEEIKKMVSNVVETDDTLVSDCFFAFSNDDYNKMFEKAELNRANLFSIEGEEYNNVQINAEQLLESLNAIDDDAIKSGDTSVIKHALLEVSGTINDTKYTQKNNFTNPFASLIENLLQKLACVLVYAIFSPKLYILILINLKTLGRDANFSLEEFMGSFKNLIVNLIRAIRDMLLKYLVNELMNVLGDIATDITVKIGREQMEYYNRLFKRMIECFKFKRKQYDWEMDNVMFADIDSEEVTEKVAEC